MTVSDNDGLWSIDGKSVSKEVGLVAKRVVMMEGHIYDVSQALKRVAGCESHGA